jgi:hypothetical protein
MTTQTGIYRPNSKSEPDRTTTRPDPETLATPASARTLPPLEQMAGHLQRLKGSTARQSAFTSLQSRFGNSYVARLAQQLTIARESAPDEASAIADCKKIASVAMGAMLKELAAMPEDHLKTMQQVVEANKVAGIDNPRFSAALDAVLAKKAVSSLKATTLDWLVSNAVAHSDEVIELKNRVGLAIFEPAFTKIVLSLGNSIIQTRQSYNLTLNNTTITSDKEGNDDPHADNEKRREKTVATYEATKAFLGPLKSITKDRPARYKCGDATVEDAILAALQLEVVFNAEATLASPTNAQADSARAVGMDNNIQWCGAFVAKSYLESELVDKMKGGFPSTERLEAFFHYQQYTEKDPKWIQDGGEWKDLKTYHTQRGSARKWIDDKTIFAEGKSGTLDIRPGDVVLLDNNTNKRAEVDVEVPDKTDPTKTHKVTKTYNYASIPANGTIKRVIEGDKADHIQMVQSWNPATRELFVVEGNSDGYIIDTDPTHPAIRGESEADRQQRQEIEAATGTKLTKPTDSSHVAAGINNLADQPDPSKLKAGRAARVYGIGRLSIVDFETQTYHNSPTKPPLPKTKVSK